MTRPAPFRVVQPWGRHVATESALISEHATAAEAFDAIDGAAHQMMRTCAPSNAIELVVIDANGNRVMRPGQH